MNQQELEFTSHLIANQALRLIRAFPQVSARLGDLDAPATQPRLAAVTSFLIKRNILHIARVEGNTAPETFTKFEQKRLISLIDILTTRPFRSSELLNLLRLDDEPSELHGLIITLYRILHALEHDTKKFDVFFNHRCITTPLLFVKTVDLANNVGSTPMDDHPVSKNYHTIYNALKTSNECTFAQWDKLTVHALAALDLLTIVEATPTQIIIDDITDLLCDNLEKTNYAATMRAIVLEHKTEFLENMISLVSRVGSMEMLLCLICLYEEITTPETRKPTDLTMPANRYSLLGQALYLNEVIIMQKLIELQNGAQFNAFDRDMPLPSGDTLVHMAVKHHHPYLIKPIIEQTGIDPHKKNDSSKTAMDLAQELNRTQAVKVLKEIIASLAQANAPAEESTAHQSKKQKMN